MIKNTQVFSLIGYLIMVVVSGYNKAFSYEDFYSLDKSEFVYFYNIDSNIRNSKLTSYQAGNLALEESKGGFSVHFVDPYYAYKLYFANIDHLKQSNEFIGYKKDPYLTVSNLYTMLGRKMFSMASFSHHLSAGSNATNIEQSGNFSVIIDPDKPYPSNLNFLYAHHSIPKVALSRSGTVVVNTNFATLRKSPEDHSFTYLLETPNNTYYQNEMALFEDIIDENEMALSEDIKYKNDIPSIGLFLPFDDNSRNKHELKFRYEQTNNKVQSRSFTTINSKFNMHDRPFLTAGRDVLEKIFLVWGPSKSNQDNSIILQAISGQKKNIQSYYRAKIKPKWEIEYKLNEKCSPSIALSDEEIVLLCGGNISVIDQSDGSINFSHNFKNEKILSKTEKGPVIDSKGQIYFITQGTLYLINKDHYQDKEVKLQLDTKKLTDKHFEHPIDLLLLDNNEILVVTEELRSNHNEDNKALVRFFVIQHEHKSRPVIRSQSSINLLDEKWIPSVLVGKSVEWQYGNAAVHNGTVLQLLSGKYKTECLDPEDDDSCHAYVTSLIRTNKVTDASLDNAAHWPKIHGNNRNTNVFISEKQKQINSMQNIAPSHEERSPAYSSASELIEGTYALLGYLLYSLFISYYQQ